MLNIVIPMAGHGSRFAQAGYTLPKPLIEIQGKPMIELVIHNLTPRVSHHFVFICLQEHIERYHVDRNLKKWVPGCDVLAVDRVTEGAACTVLLAKKLINSSNPLMIANSDQWVDIDINDYLSALEKNYLDGIMLTMTAQDPKWSFIRVNAQNLVTEVVEKKVISDEATIGIYNFSHGDDFVQAAERMIQKNLRVNNEFYVAPVYNELIADGQRIGFYNIGRNSEKIFGLGTPPDLEFFLKSPVVAKATRF